MNPRVEELLQILRAQAIIKRVRVVNLDETPAGKLELKIRCRLIKNYRFQLWLHLEPAFQDYAYQLFADRPILRWDNSPHYPSIPTAPHHFHDEMGNVKVSHLSGEPLKDLPVVLEKITAWLNQAAKR